MNKFFLVLIFSVFVASISQIFLKIGSNKNYKTLLKEYLNPFVILGYFLLFISTILTIFALSSLDYKNIPIIESLGYIFIMILSKIILKEKITFKKIFGNLLILAGIFVFYF